MATPVQDHVKEIVKLIEKQSYTHDRYTLFSDNVAAMAISISNAVDLGHRDEREKRYMNIVDKYDKATVETFPQVMGHVVMALGDAPQDVLGSVFHQLELHNSARGQFFTPYHVSKLMAEMTLADDLQAKVDAKGYVTAHEPACGSGAKVIALAEAMRERGINYQQQLHVTAVDIDERAAHMAYVQLSLLNIPAAVYLGNTLTMEMRDVYHTPAHVLGGWEWKLNRDRALESARDLEDPRTPPPAERADIEVSPLGEQLSLLEPALDLDLDRGGMEL